MTGAPANPRHDASLQVLLPYPCDGLLKGPLTTGTQREADGRVFEVYFDVISALLDNSTRFVVLYVSYPWVDLPPLMHPLPATPTAAPSFVYSTTFIATTHTLNPSAHLVGTNNVAPFDATFHDASFFDSPCHEDPASGASFYFGGRHPGSCKGQEGRDLEGTHRGTWCEGRCLGDPDAGIRLVSWNRYGVFRVLLRLCMPPDPAPFDFRTPFLPCSLDRSHVYL